MTPEITAQDIDNDLLRMKESQAVTKSKVLPVPANGEILVPNFEDLDNDAHEEEQSTRQLLSEHPEEDVRRSRPF